MRSVFLYLIDTKYEDIRAVLSDFAQPQASDQWSYPRSATRPCVHLQLSTDFSSLKPDELAALKKALGKSPEVSLTANCHDQAPDDSEVRRLVDYVLARFRGVANDNFTTHYWTHSEIRSSSFEVDGHDFFDHEGQHRDAKRP